MRNRNRLFSRIATMRMCMIPLLILTACCLGADESGIKQGYILYEHGLKTEVRGRVTSSVLASETNASVAFQIALDKLKEQGGGKLEVEQGEYIINRPLEISSDTTVSGSGKGTVFIVGEENEEGIIFLAKTQDRVVIENLLCDGRNLGGDTATGVIFEACGFSTIRAVYAKDFRGYGFWVRKNSFACKLENNYTSGNDRAGTFIDGTTQSRGGAFVPNKLIGCYSYAEDGNAFEFHKAICQDIVGCVSHLAKGIGIYMYKSTSNLISGNRIFMGQSHGILIEETFEMNISSNICGWNWGDNLILDHCVWGTVTANEFIDAGGREREGYGIVMKRGTKSIQVTGNAIFNWWDNKAMAGGIYESDDCLENQITNNVINYYKEFDVKSLGRNSLVAYNMGLPHPYGPPRKGPDVPNVEPEDIKLNMHINDSRAMAESYLNGNR